METARGPLLLDLAIPGRFSSRSGRSHPRATPCTCFILWQDKMMLYTLARKKKGRAAKSGEQANDSGTHRCQCQRLHCPDTPATAVRAHAAHHRCLQLARDSGSLAAGSSRHPRLLRRRRLPDVYAPRDPAVHDIDWPVSLAALPVSDG
jgi:hypothetical protein